MNPMKIESKLVGPGRPTLVVAEIGVNHDGSLSKALELVRIASNCGADAVKLQVFRTTSLLHPSCQLAGYQKDRMPLSTNPVDMLRRYEMSSEDLAKIVKSIRDVKMIPLATPFSPIDLDLIERLRLPAIKIASPDLVNRPLLSAAAKLNKPLLVSTGAATIEEVHTSFGWLKALAADFALLHCISAYPVPSSQANLCWIQELARQFDVPVGYSDHTTEQLSGALAAAAGAMILEKHLTYDRDARGPDHAASVDPQQFSRYVKFVRDADVMRGAPGKTVLPIEEEVRVIARQSLVVRRTLKEGDLLREEDLTVQRPGTGLSAAMVAEAVGRKIIRPVQAGAMLQWDMLDAA